MSKYRTDRRYREYQRRYQRDYMLMLYHSDPKHREAVKKRARDTARQNKLIVLDVYGNSRCVCCGEKEVAFLTIDHINNDGRQHRQQVGAGSRLYRWLIANNFPDGYQVLCFNCNCGRQVNGGICPHEQERAA